MGSVVRMPVPATSATWPIAGDAPDLLTIVQEQAGTITAMAALATAYQDWLNQEQAAPALRPAAFGNGTSSGTPATTLTVSGLTGTIAVPCRVAGAGITTAPTNIIAQQSGTAGSNGVYTTDEATTCTSAALTFTPPAQPMAWPLPGDAPTLNQIAQDQSALIRTLNAAIQQYQILLNDSQTPAPPTGP